MKSNRRKITPIIWALFVIALIAIGNCLPSSCFAQKAPDIEWQRCLGGSGFEDGYSIAQTFDGGFVIAGFVESTDGDVSGNHGSSDMWVVKLNGLGVPQWQRCLGGTDGDHATCIAQTIDGGFIVSGITFSTDGDVTGNHGSPDAWIVKLDRAGSIQWKKCYGGTGYDGANWIVQTPDSGYAFAGVTHSNDGDVSGNHSPSVGDGWVVRLDATGAILWQKCLGGSENDELLCIINTADHGFALAGRTFSADGDVVGNHGDYDAWAVKLDSAGTLQWQRCIGGDSTDHAHSIAQTRDGGYIVSGHTASTDLKPFGYHKNDDALLAKLNASGEVEWVKCFGGSGDEEAYGVCATADGGYAFAGPTRSSDGDVKGYHGGNGEDIWLVKLDSAANIEWQECLGDTADDYANTLIPTSDGGFAIVGYTFSTGGEVSGNHGGGDIWVVRLGDKSRVMSSSGDEVNSCHLSLYPNPSATTETIAYDLPFASTSVVDIRSPSGVLERELQLPVQPPGHHELRTDLDGLANGTYFVSIEACGLTETIALSLVR